MIFNCYRLAFYFHRDPDEMLNKPLTQLHQHLFWMNKLIESQKPDEDNDG